MSLGVRPLNGFFTEWLERCGSRQVYAFLGLEKSRVICNPIFLPPNVDFDPTWTWKFSTRITNGNILP